MLIHFMEGKKRGSKTAMKKITSLVLILHYKRVVT